MKAEQTSVRSGGGNIVNVKQLLNDETRDYILIIKEAGKFYRAYDIDALIINMLIGYQVTMGPKIGFPDNALSKVINRLEENKISYRSIVKGQIEKEYNYKKLNQYNKFASIARKTADLNNRLDLIVKKVKKADDEKISEIIEYLENV
ncbi:MAG TPA: hypothetical protein IAB65_02170 [Candidatus Onthocola stercorigallinarum]|nr:hypothetical protein [Candidatus Onthocola stercorigallinarum]